MERIDPVDAIRKLADVKDHKVILELPESFKHDRVEVIILPCESLEATPEGDTSSWQQDFLSVSCWDEEDGEVTVQSWPLKAF